MGRILPFLSLVFLVLPLAALSYLPPCEVVRFDDEPGSLGFVREGAGHGPLRLLASDTALYLLARLRHKAYVFDLDGRVLDSMAFEYCPGDMTYDSQGRLHVLQFRTRPEFVASYQQGSVIELREFRIPETRSMKEIGVSPSGEVHLLSGGYTYRIMKGEGGNKLLPWGERTGRFHITDTHIERLPGSWQARFTSQTSAGSLPEVNLSPVGWELFQFHADDRAGRAYIVGTSVQMGQDGEKYVARRLLVAEDGKIITRIADIRAGHPSYDYANHDIAVAPSGDVYLFCSNFAHGFSRILYYQLEP